MSISMLKAQFIWHKLSVILKDIHNKILNLVKWDIFAHQYFSNTLVTIFKDAIQRFKILTELAQYVHMLLRMSCKWLTDVCLI